MEENKNSGNETVTPTTAQATENNTATASVPAKKEESAKTDAPKQSKSKKAKGTSFTSYFLKLITTFFVHVIDSSRIAGCFTNDAKTKQAYRESAFFGYFKSGKMQLWLLNKKHNFLSQLETSHFRLGKKEISSTLMKTPLRYYGAFLMAFASICCFAYWIDLRYLGNYFAVPASQPVMCIPILIIGIALLFLNATPIEYVRTSFFLQVIVFNFFGATLKYDDSPTRQYHYPLPLLLGGLIGAISLVVPLKTLLLILACVIFGAMILKSPETGVLLTIAGIFFLPALYAGCIILVTWISFGFKFFSGKRILKYEYVDLTVAFVWLIVLLGGVFSLGKLTFASVITPFFITSVYFLITGLIHDRIWAGRCRVAMTACGAIAALSALFRRLPGNPLRFSMQIFSASDLGGSYDSALENSGVLTLLLAMLFFIQLANFYSRKNRGEKIGHLLLCALFATAVLIGLTPRAAILFVTLALFATLIMAKGLRFMLPLTVAFFVIAPVFGAPTLTDIYNAAANDVIARHGSWGEYVKLIQSYDLKFLLSGFGLRPDALTTVSPDALGGTEPKGWLLYGIAALGLPAVIFFAFIVTVRVLKYCLTHCRHCSNKTAQSRLYTHAGLLALTYMLLLGITENVGHNYRSIAFFWLILGFTVSAQRYAVRDTANEYSHYSSMMSDV